MILQHHLQFVVLLLSQHLRSLLACVEHPVVTECLLLVDV